MSTSARPRRGEIWLVDFEPQRGAETDKRRPAVVVSSDYVGRLPLKLVVPITTWKDHFESSAWHLRISPDRVNNLDNDSALDAFQVKSVSLERFVHKIGVLTQPMMQDLAAAIASVIEYV